jgi:glycosyltransferase involved in cell wall biosynthesis
VNIVHTESSCGWGGQELRILAEAQGMAARGHAITLLVPREARIHDAALARGLSTVALPIARKRPAGAFALRRWLAGHAVDVVNTHSSTDTWLAALACATLARAPAIVRTRHISAAVPDNVATRWLYVRATRHIVTTGEALRAQLVRDNRYPAGRITSVPTGIDAARFSPGDRDAARRETGLPPGRTVIGIVATLRSWKGHLDLLEACARLPGAPLVAIVGDGPMLPNIEARIAALGIADRVVLAGNRADVRPWLRAFDVFALPSYANEGVPQALVQAMLCALPCVTTDVGSIGEVARDGDTAIVVRPRDAAGLQNGLERLLADAGLRAHLGERARAHCARHCGVETMLDRMEAVFRTAASGRA